VVGTTGERRWGRERGQKRDGGRRGRGRQSRLVEFVFQG
jgi:hypothetical protein